MRQHFLVILVSLCSFFGVFGQQVSFDVSPSFSSGISYSSDMVDSKLGSRLSLGFSFEHNFTSNWSLVSGIHFGRLGSQINVKDQTFSSNRIDDRDSAFELRITPRGFQEFQHQNYYKIPLLGQYTMSLFKGSNFYVALGGSYYSFTSQPSRVKASSIQVTGYYADTNLEIDNAPNHGFGSLNGVSSVSSTDYKNFFALSFETGLRWNIKTNFYLGVFFDYGLTDLQKKEGGNLVIHNSSSLGTDKIKGVSYLSEIGKPQFYNIGLKFRMGLFNLY